MLHFTHFLTLLALTLVVGTTGCMVSSDGPKKIIATSPDGRPSEFPSMKAAAAASAAPPEPSPAPPRTWATGTVAQAAYLEPASAMPAIKPFPAWSEQEAAADALGRIGAAAVPALIDALHDPDPAVRIKATAVLGRMGSDAKDAVPHLVKLLDDPDESVRKAATRTLGRIGPPADQAVPALVRTLLQPPS
jgi:hypothetical protein